MEKLWRSDVYNFRKDFTSVHKMFPVLLFVCLATAQVFSVLASNRSAAIGGPRSAAVWRNSSTPDNSSRTHSSDANPNFDGGCRNCGAKPPPQKGSLEYKLRIEMIKRQILDRLHMVEEPKIQRPKQGIPQPLVNAKFLESPLVQDDENKQNNKTAQVILIGTKDTSTSSRKKTNKTRKTRFRFNFSTKIYNNAILTATLWVYRPKTKSNRESHEQTLTIKDYTITDVSKGQNTDPIAINKKLKTKDQEWVSIDVKMIVDKWKRQSKNSTQSLEIFSNNCTYEPIASRGQLRPFLVLDLVSGKSRKKRALNCVPGIKECCRQEFYVSFQEMGWQNWIMAPQGFNANYCTGSCYGHILPAYHHTEVMQKVALLRKQQEITPCCSPTQMFGLSLIYFDDDENLFHEDVPKMIIEKCGCT